MAKGKRLRLGGKGKKRRVSLQNGDFQFLLKNTSFDKKNIEEYYEVGMKIFKVFHDSGRHQISFSGGSNKISIQGFNVHEILQRNGYNIVISRCL